jgi:hypothetical protein
MISHYSYSVHLHIKKTDIQSVQTKISYHIISKVVKRIEVRCTFNKCTKYFRDDLSCRTPTKMQALSRHELIRKYSIKSVR